MSVKITHVKRSEIPLPIDCPNPGCDAKLNITLGDLQKNKLVVCSSCGTNVQLNNN